MSRQEERLVREIRRKRQQVLHDLGDLSSRRELERRVRRAPLLWIVGAAVLGLVMARFMAPHFLARGRNLAREWIWTRLRTTLVAAVVAAAAPRQAPRS